MGRCGGWVDILNKVLAELVGRTAPADSEVAGFLRVAWKHGWAITESIEGTGRGWKLSGRHTTPAMFRDCLVARIDIPLVLAGVFVRT